MNQTLPGLNKAGAQAATKASHIAPLDGVRGLAALMVMVFHYWQGKGFQRLGVPDRLSNVSVFGQTGVDLFFVLSGFLITRILIASRDRPGYFPTFYGRRSLRIFPLYYLFLVISLFVVPLLEGTPVSPFSQTWWFWVYLQNVPDTFTQFASAGPFHYWTLAVEEHFYLFWPVAIYLVPKRYLAALSLSVIALAALVRGVFIYSLKVPVFYFTLCRMDALAFGALLASIECAGKLPNYRKVLGITLAVSVPALSLVWTRLTGTGTAILQVFKFSLIGLVYTAFLGLVASYKDSPMVARAFGNRPLRELGKISYGLYVYHPLCYHFIDRAPVVGRIPALNLLACFGTAIAASWLSFRIFETPFLSWKDSLFAPKQSPDFELAKAANSGVAEQA